MHAVPSLRHSHWEQGSLEHLAKQEQEQQVPSKGKVLRGVRSTCWRFRRRGLGLMLVLPSSSLWRLPVAMSTLTGGAFVGAPTLGGAGTQILTEFVLLAPGVRGERLLVWGQVNMLHMLKKFVDARGVRFNDGVKPVESPAAKYTSPDTLSVFFALSKGAISSECNMIGRF